MVVRRREFLRAGTAALAAGAVCLHARGVRADTGATHDPFTLGVASGFPRPDSVVLWTRLAPHPLAPRGGMPAHVVPVTWELAADEHMGRIVRSGTAFATPEWAHALHVEPTGLEPDRWYWYRFRAGGALSPIGRTRTAPGEHASPSRLRIALASCQMYEHGHYAAYRHITDDAPDLVVHVGDYVYERSWGADKVRRHPWPEAYTLDDYRALHALYKTDRDLQAAHAAGPWLITFDDHEVDNDYAGAVSQSDDEPQAFLARRAAAYRACYEHLPLPRRAVPFGAHMRLHASLGFGDLVRIFSLDGRQHRSAHACPPPGRRGGRRVELAACPELLEPGRTMLGARQEAWLGAGLGRSRARWNLLAQQTVMSYLDERPGPGEAFWTDGWNGYPRARTRLLAALRESGASNPVVLSGDLHAFLAGHVFESPRAADAATGVPELVTTSITSRGLPQHVLDRLRSENPHVLLADSRRRGYLRIELDAKRLQADLVALDDVRRRDSAREVLASFVLEAGAPRLERADGGGGRG